MMKLDGRTLFRDRLTGRSVSAPPLTDTLVGRWVLGSEVAPAFMNSVAAAPRDFIVPDRSAHWSVLTGDGERLSGTVSKAGLPDELEVDSVCAIGERLKELMHSGGGWLEWSEVVPLAPGISGQLDLLPLDRLIQEPGILGALQAVCSRPRTYLHVEIERTPVSRARRIPPAAASYLAGHTEDWDRPLLRGILPKRVLAEVRHDQVDIYENRVVARLIDNLIAHLTRRVQLVRRLLKVFKEKEDYSRSVGGTYQRSRRISELWGQSVEAGEGRKRAESVLKELESLRYRLMGLLGSPLYEGVPRRAQVSTTLKSTNVLSSDQDYRRIAELWREWAQSAGGRTLSPEEAQADAQRLCRGLDAFAMLLAVRALSSLGYEPTDAVLEHPIKRGAALRLQGNGLKLTLEWSSDGVIGIREGERELRVVALAVNLQSGQDERVRESLRRIKAATQEVKGRGLLVLLLAADDERTALEAEVAGSLHTVGNDPRHALSGGGCLPVSPWELGSTERIARALRSFLLSPRFLNYPFQVVVSKEAGNCMELGRHSQWVSSTGGEDTLQLRRPLRPDEWEKLGVEAQVHRVRSDLQGARALHEQLSSELRAAVRKSKTGALASKKHAAQQDVQRLERLEVAVVELAEGLRSAYSRTRDLLVCPTCKQEAEPVHEFQVGDGTFQCKCGGCGTTWGTLLCRCGQPYASMLPSGKFAEPAELRPGWEDRLYGCDLLAMPARAANGEWAFVCCKCGEVS